MPSRRLSLVVPQIVGRLNVRGLPGVEPETAEAIARAYDEALFPLQRYLESLGGAQDESIPAGQYDGVPEILDTTVGEVGDPEAGWSPGPHRHQVLVGPPAGLGNASAAGLADELSDALHVHKRDVRVKLNGSDVATKNALDFQDGDVLWTIDEDVPGDELNIEGTLSADFATKSPGATVKNASGASECIVWIAPFAATVVAVKAIRINGGTGATVNARRNLTDEHLASDLSLPTLDVVADGGAVQNTAYAAGDVMEVMVTSTAGGPSDVSITVFVEQI